jgi:hypothetical protein
MTEQLHVAALAAAGLARPLGHEAQFSSPRRKYRQQAIRFAKVRAPQDKGFGAIHPRTS